MRKLVCLGVVVVLSGCVVGLAGCGSAQVTATAARVTGVAASCAAVSPAEQFAMARRVFVGVMLPGPSTQSGVLGSPARMRVERYLKGRGPRTVRVVTALRIEPGGITGGSEGILPRAGQRWKIYTDSDHQPFATSVCSGSVRVTSSHGGTGHRGAPTGASALALWRKFPAHATPRPVVPLGEGTVLDPASGFHTNRAKFAYLGGRFALRAPLPRSLITVGGFPVVSAGVAYHRLRAQASRQYENVPPLVITRVTPGSAVFATDRGRMRLPAWKFFFRGVVDPASVLAVAPPSVFFPPPLHRFGQAGPGSSIEDSATMSASGTSITISFVGSPAGTDPCDANYRATALSARRAVAFTIRTIAVPVPPGEACPAIGIFRTVMLHLSRPLGPRALVSAVDGGAVPVTPAP